MFPRPKPYALFLDSLYPTQSFILVESCGVRGQGYCFSVNTVYDQLLVALFNTAQCLSPPFLRSLKSNWHVASVLPTSSLTIPPHSHAQYTNLQYSACAHKHRNTSSPLGGAQKFPVRKACHRNPGNNWVSEKVLGPISVSFSCPVPLLIELLLHRLFYSRQKQLSIWFPLFLCWQGSGLASFCPRVEVLLIHKERWHWFIWTHWASCVACFLIAIQRNQLKDVHVIWHHWD